MPKTILEIGNKKHKIDTELGPPCSCADRNCKPCALGEHSNCSNGCRELQEAWRELKDKVVTAS